MRTAALLATATAALTTAGGTDSFRETFRIRSAAPRVCSTKES